MDDVERSPSGSPILRHERADQPFTPSRQASNTEEIERRVAELVGPTDTVFHEVVSDLIHLDVHVARPSPSREWWTLFTVGMSALPMTVPDDYPELRFAELAMKLPHWWKVDALGVTPPPADLEEWYWPIRGLKSLARLPHDYGTWLGFGHTVPNGDPAEPLAERTDLCAWLILPLLGMSNELRLSDGTVLNLYAVHAIHRDELELKLTEGIDALLDRFDAANVSEVLDPSRQSAVG
jgi:hypothetical protein